MKFAWPTISLFATSHLGLPDHVHGFDTLDGPPRSLKGFIALLGPVRSRLPVLTLWRKATGLGMAASASSASVQPIPGPRLSMRIDP